MQNQAAIQNCRWQIMTLENSQQDAQAQIVVLRRKIENMEGALQCIAKYRAKLEYDADRTKAAAKMFAEASRLRLAKSFGEAFSGKAADAAAYNKSAEAFASLKAHAEDEIRACEDETNMLSRRIEEENYQIYSLRQRIAYLSAVG